MQLACFGFITCFDLNSETCQGCDEVRECQKRCYATLQSMDSGVESIRKLTNKHERWARKIGNEVKTSTAVRENFQVPPDDARIRGLNKLSCDVASALIHNYVDMRSVGDTSTINPMYLRIMLSHYQTGRFETRAVRDSLKTAMKWTDSTAKSYASAFVSVLVHWDLVTRVKRGLYEVVV